MGRVLRIGTIFITLLGGSGTYNRNHNCTSKPPKSQRVGDK